MQNPPRAVGGSSSAAQVLKNSALETMSLAAAPSITEPLQSHIVMPALSCSTAHQYMPNLRLLLK